jgi:hypothetical protein
MGSHMPRLRLGMLRPGKLKCRLGLAPPAFSSGHLRPARLQPPSYTTNTQKTLHSRPLRHRYSNTDYPIDPIHQSSRQRDTRAFMSTQIQNLKTFGKLAPPQPALATPLCPKHCDADAKRPPEQLSCPSLICLFWGSSRNLKRGRISLCW